MSVISSTRSSGGKASSESRQMTRQRNDGSKARGFFVSCLSILVFLLCTTRKAH
jgi:hypothetical protein